MSPDREGVPPDRLERAVRLVDLAWHDLPREHRVLLESVGASQRAVVDRPLGDHLSSLMVSAGRARLPGAQRVELNLALGVWTPVLRLVLVDAGHPALNGLDDASYAMMLVRTAWHEWGHALSIGRASPDEVRRGAAWLELAPSGVRDGIRRGAYRPRELTHEVVAEIYALLMARRRRGQVGRPEWLDHQLYDLLRRVCGWTD